VKLPAKRVLRNVDLELAANRTVQPFAEIQNGHKVAGDNSEYPRREDLVSLTVRVTWKNHAPTFALLAHPRSGQDPN
jgi:hypothetical protein